jgi:hypothetical protein
MCHPCLLLLLLLLRHPCLLLLLLTVLWAWCRSHPASEQSTG